MAPQLPIEIIIQIFSYFRTVKYADLAIHDRPLLLQEDQTLAQACLTCNTIKNIAEPLLYKMYYQAAITSTDNLDNKSCPHWRSRLFLRSLLERPILASHLEHVIVEDLGPSRRSNPSLAGASSSVDKLTRLLTNATEGLDLGKRQNDWFLGLETGVEDADIALLLLLSPKLVELDIAISSSTNFAGLEESFFPSAISASKGLKKIAMCNLTLRGPPPAYPATITCIELRHCLLPGQVEVAFSKSCAALESFILTDWYPSGWDAWQTWKPLIVELGRHRQCLKTLSLSAFPETDLYDAEIEDFLWRNIGSLYHFTALKHLIVQETALLGPVADSGHSCFPGTQLDCILPPSLETLKIYQCTLLSVTQLESLAFVFGERLPSLRYIYLQFPDFEPWGCGEQEAATASRIWENAKAHLEDTKSRFRAAGVSLDIIFSPMRWVGRELRENCPGIGSRFSPQLFRDGCFPIDIID